MSEPQARGVKTALVVGAFAMPLNAPTAIFLADSHERANAWLSHTDETRMARPMAFVVTVSTVSITIVETEHSAVALIISPLSSVCSGNGRRGRAPRSTMSA